ncbi:hypothetical protein Dimus_020966 [Dionaea muscipula]
MALFRKFFYRKPPDGLLEIAERVYVFDCCFTTDAMEDEDYTVYIGGVASQLRAHFPDASFVAFNFREGHKQSEIGDILSDYDMTVMDYPRQYEGCPLLPMEMIHHFLRSCESWLVLGQQNVLLMHCERGGWPILAFMLAALLIYRKQYSGEQKTLDMIHKQAPRELLQLMSPLNPLPSQLRYLQYVSRRNMGSGWPPLDRALTLDCIILRFTPNMDGEGGCCPILRIYGRDPLLAADQTSKLLFATPKRSKGVCYYRKVDCELVKIDIHCHVQGDVVLECISLDNDLTREKMMFRVVFNTAFIRSNILMLNRDEIDILWDAKDLFPREFRAEVLFSGMDSADSVIPIDLPAIGEGLPVEAFAKVQELFSTVDWLDSKADVARNVLQQITASSVLREKLEIAASRRAVSGSLEPSSPRSLEKTNSRVLENSPTSLYMVDQVPSSVHSDKLLNVRFGELGQITSSTFLGEDSQIDSSQRIESGCLEVRSTDKLNEIPIRQAAEDNSQQFTCKAVDDWDTRIKPSLRGKTNPEESISSPSIKELEIASSQVIESSSSEVSGSEQLKVQVKPQASDGDTSSAAMAVEKLSVPAPPPLHEDLIRKKIQPEKLIPAKLQPSQSKIISSRILHSSQSSPSLYGHALRGSSVPLPRYHSAPSSLGITAVLQDHASYERKGASHLVAAPLSSFATSVISIPKVPEHEEPSVVSSVPPSSSPPPPPPLPPPYSSATHTSLQPLSVPLVSSPLSIPESSNPLDDGKLGSSSHPSHDKVISPPQSLGIHSPSAISHSTVRIAPKPSSLPPPPPPPSEFTMPSTCRKSLPAPPSPLPSPGIVSSATDMDSMPFSLKECSPVSGPPLPPPPPKSAGSGPDSCPSSAPFVPPPPPPPRASAEECIPGPGASARAPPVPPPPGPSVKGLPNSNDSCHQSLTSGSNGPVPPAPGPPMTGKGRGPPRLTPRSQGQSKRTSLKPYHWLKLTRVMQGSLWAEVQRYDEASRAPEFDMAEIERLFAASLPNSEHVGAGGISNRRASGPKSDKVQLIELRRAYNCEIMLSKVKIPLPDLMNSVLALDDLALDVDQVENLIKFCPTKEEMELLKGYNGDMEKLGKCEQFFLEMMKVPRVESKLRVFLFKMQFGSQVFDLRRNLNLVNSASEEIRNSVKLKRTMQAILSLGNALNHGTARGSAVGFRLDSLLKLTDTRARNNKMTLMHYLCKVLAEKLPELLEFSKDLGSLEAATKIQLKFLAEEMQAINKGLEKVVQELTASENDGPVSENFCKTLKDFLAFAEGEVRTLSSLYSNVGWNADALATYFGEDPARCPFEQVVSTLLNFVRMFVRAHEENCKQIEFEKKKALKEAENEQK